MPMQPVVDVVEYLRSLPEPDDALLVEIEAEQGHQPDPILPEWHL